MNKLTFLLAFCLFQMTWSQNIEISYKVKFRPQKENDLTGVMSAIKNAQINNNSPILILH